MPEANETLASRSRSLCPHWPLPPSLQPRLFISTQQLCSDSSGPCEECGARDTGPGPKTDPWKSRERDLNPLIREQAQAQGSVGPLSHLTAPIAFHVVTSLGLVSLPHQLLSSGSTVAQFPILVTPEQPAQTLAGTQQALAYLG